jgi:large subunit ribosomal protein L43
MNGRSKDICVRNLEKEQILKKVEILQKANGEKLKTLKKPVISSNESVRGIWSGLHGHEISVGLEGTKARR